jgi:cell division protein FtsB
MRSQRRWQIWKSPYFWLVAVALLALPLLADFNVRLAYSRQLTAQEAQLQQQISDEQARQTALKELAQYVKSDAYVEHWARMARLTKPGEVPVVPVPSELDHKGDAAQSTARPANDIRSEWWLVLFDRTSSP